MIKNPAGLLNDAELPAEQIEEILAPVGFADWRIAYARLRKMAATDKRTRQLAKSLPMLLTCLSEAATPDTSLLNLERLYQTVADPQELLEFLALNPRAVEILVKLFVGSQFLTEILLRNPDYLQQLTHHKRVAEFKSRQDFRAAAEKAMVNTPHLDDKLNALKRFQHWEMLRIGACDSFGLMDLRSVTVQLSLLADAIVQTALAVIADHLNVSIDGFCVLAFGKLGGEELNYSSDIDLVFICKEDAVQYWELGQRLIRSLMDTTSEGFLYRVDMRLRPWGKSGPLVTGQEDYLNYLADSAALWEKQALLKARPIAGSLQLGFEFIDQLTPIIFDAPVEEARLNVREMKLQIEQNLSKQGRTFGEVKSGHGSIRDIEFVTQFLQLKHGRKRRQLRSINTLDGLVRLSDFDCILPPEFRQLTTAYVFLRKIEHSLQLMHYKQEHSLPNDEREMMFLARRLDFPDTESFLQSYQQHCMDVRRIFDKYIENSQPVLKNAETDSPSPSRHASVMAPSYTKVFAAEQIQLHAKLLAELSDKKTIVTQARERSEGRVELTICGYDQRGNLALMCGLLFVYGFDIVNGNVFTADDVLDAQPDVSKRATFVNVFNLKPPLQVTLSSVWDKFRNDLSSLLEMAIDGKLAEAQGQLAKRVARGLRDTSNAKTTLLPIEIQIDNESSMHRTALHISAEDTPGFLYELTNALALAGYDIHRVELTTLGDRVIDRLFIAGPGNKKITDPVEQARLRATVVLVKHFTHFLPGSPNPEKALRHFRQFFEQILEQPNWADEVGTLVKSEVLESVARLLGVSDFLWEDFLRLQHDNLFPVVTDIDGLATQKHADELRAELQVLMDKANSFTDKCSELNAFKDREMFRVDMRHIVGRIPEFGAFSRELTDVVEVVATAAFDLARNRLHEKYGWPQDLNGDPLPVSIFGLGKAGGRELGFGSDIELMFVFDGEGRTAGARKISESEFFVKLAESFTKIIIAKRKGIFEIDMRLRPYGQAGPLAISKTAFHDYFKPAGPAWPYERQALVRMRSIAGDEKLGQAVEKLRDSIVFIGEAFDVAAMRAMRERQLRQLVHDGRFNAKLGAGGLVDCEYLVQALQITHGHRSECLRSTNTLTVWLALRNQGLVSFQDYETIKDSYIFWRRMIDALRMVRGDARDLTIPDASTEEFEYLAGRLGYGLNTRRLADQIEQTAQAVTEAGRLLDQLIG